MRRVRYFLSSFRVVVETDHPVGLDRLYGIREVISSTFRDAQKEYVPEANVLDSPVNPHVFVSQIRHGSLEFQVIYQGLINLPWHEIVQTAGHIASQGLVVVEHLGKIVAALETMKRIAPWIQKRLRGSHGAPQEGAAPHTSVSQEASLHTDPQALSNSNFAGQTAHRLLHDPHPRALIVLLDEQSIAAVRSILRVTAEQDTRHLGGGTIIHDMNLMMNDLSSLDELRDGDPFCLHNVGAMGLQIARNKDSLFEACAAPNSPLKIDELTLDHIDFPEEHRIAEGPSISIDDLPS